jgi:hypothetical protein
MSEANKTMVSSPVFRLPNSFPFIHREYSWRDFVAQRMSNLQDKKVRGPEHLLNVLVLMQGMHYCMLLHDKPAGRKGAGGLNIS